MRCTSSSTPSRSCTGSAATAGSSRRGPSRSASTCWRSSPGWSPCRWSSPAAAGPRVAAVRADFLVSFYWPTVLVVSICFLATLYHVSIPVRTKWRINLPGATFALGVWLLGSFLLREFLTVTAADSRSIYGPLAAPIAVLLWLYILSIAVLVGAALNASLRHRLPPAAHRARAQWSSSSACAASRPRRRPARSPATRRPWTRFALVPPPMSTIPSHGSVVLPDRDRSPWWALTQRVLLGARHHRVHRPARVRRPRRLPRRQRPARTTRSTSSTRSTTRPSPSARPGTATSRPVTRRRPADQRVRDHAAAHRVPGAADRHHARGAGHPGSAHVPHLPLEEDHESDHVVIVGYGTKGRSAVETLVNNGIDRDQIVVVDKGGQAVSEAHADGLAVVTGDATRSRGAPARRRRRGAAGHHHHRPRRLQRAGDADRPPAQRRRLDRRVRARARERTR